MMPFKLGTICPLPMALISQFQIPESWDMENGLDLIPYPQWKLIVYLIFFPCWYLLAYNPHEAEARQGVSR